MHYVRCILEARVITSKHQDSQKARHIDFGIARNKQSRIQESREDSSAIRSFRKRK